MSHQRQLEASKYRNWVRGGLAYKYLKEGIEGFTDEVVLREHNRILHVAKQTPGLTCNQCCLKNLRPLHKCHKDPVTGKNKCHWGQLKCNCLSIKDTRPCRDKVCDVIMEEILKSHASTPPAPNFRNTDMRKWCSAPWEIAKCFINAPGYADKTNAADIDAAGLLHVFINNKNLKSHLPCIINGSDDNFNKTLQRRNTIFHSPTMELEDKEMNECIDDIVAILKDDKELKDRYEAIQAIDKLKQLKERNFIITSHCEVEVCRATITSITKELEGLKQTIQDAQNDMKRIEATKAVEIEDSDSRFEILYERVEKVESEITTIEQRVTDVESMENKLHVIRDCHRKQLEFVKAKQELQHNLVKLYQQYYVKTSLSPLKLRENDINIQEIYVSPRMVMLPKSEKCNKNTATYRNKLIDIQQVKSCSENAASPKPVPIHSYHEIFQTDGHKHKKIYILGDVGSGKSSFCKMMIQNWCSAVSHNSGDFVLDNHSESYTNGTYENTDKSGASDNELTYLSTSISESDIDFQCNDDDSTEGNGNINEMGKFDLLFFIPLQRMSGINEIKEMIKAIATYAGFTSNDTFIERLFEQESECCLIVVDGLDEWTLPKSTNLLPHVSYGLPNTGGTKQATVLTLSRPSAKGVLNMKSSEYDQKVELLGINVKSVKCFIEKYISKFNKTDVSSSTFLKKIETAKLEHLERTPLLLQQVLWLYCCTGNEIGKSVSDTYSHLVNIMLAWSQNKDEEERSTEHLNCVTKQDNSSLQLPRLLHRFPRCKANKRFLLQLAEVAFETWARGTGSSTFGRSELLDKGLSKDDIDTIIKLGILVEENCFDPTKENTKFEFIHVSYLEYFVALHISSHYEEEQWSLDWEDISVVDALHESNTLKMICGLSPLYISELSSNISECVNRDESIIKYRNSLSYSEKKKPYQIQSLLFDCLSECDLTDQPVISLCDVLVDNSKKMSIVQRIIPDDVISLFVTYTSNVEKWKWIARLKLLQYLYITCCWVSHNEMELLASLLQEAPLKCISFHRVQCHQTDCKGHEIEISQHIQNLEFELCNNMIISNLNTKYLEQLLLQTPSCNTFILNYGCLENASCLKELVLQGDGARRFKYNKQLNSVLHTLQQLKKLELTDVDIADNAFTVTAAMRNLQDIELWRVIMSLKTWCTFVDSLPSLHQSVFVGTCFCPICDEFEESTGRNYIRHNRNMFEVVHEEADAFVFSKP